MGRTRKAAINPFYNQFIYDVVYNSPQESRRKLDPKYLRACRTAVSLRAYLQKSSTDEKDEMLLQLGVQWCKVFFDTGYPQKKFLRDIFEPYRHGYGSTSLMTNIIQSRIFVTSDKDFAQQLGSIAQLQNHPSYTHALLLNKAGFHLEKWKKNLNESTTKQAEESLKNSAQLVSVILSTIQTFEYVEGLLGILKNDIKILLYLYGRKSRPTKFENILSRFAGDMSKSKLTSGLRRMMQEQKVSRGANMKDPDYSITGVGIMSVNTFFQTILKANEIQ